MANSILDRIKFSNLALIALLAALAAGILLDGRLYNKPPPKLSIYSIDEPKVIEIHFGDQMAFEFKKFNQLWQQTNPMTAPVLQQRVQALLDTNQYAQRSYSSSSLPVDEIFQQAITLKINGSSYEFGTIEPVSKLRYVRANHQVYLQPDTVIPLLSAANNAFIDLKITERVQGITVEDTAISDLDAWSNLTATDIAPHNSKRRNSDQALKITLIQNDDTQTFTAYQANPGFFISSTNGFDYLISDKAAEQTGIADFFPTPNNKPDQ